MNLFFSSLFLVLSITLFTTVGTSQTTRTILHLSDTHSTLSAVGPRTNMLESTQGGIAHASSLIGVTKSESVSERTAPVREGEEISVYDNLGGEMSAKLLSVRPNSLLLLKPECFKDLKSLDCIGKLNYSNIKKLVIEGNSNLGLGIGLGVGASIITGAIIFSTNMPDHSFAPGKEAMEKSLVPIIVASSFLIAIGIAIGSHNSTPDVVFDSFNEDDIKGLSAYSRCPFKEPEWLQKIE